MFFFRMHFDYLAKYKVQKPCSTSCNFRRRFLSLDKHGDPYRDRKLYGACLPNDSQMSNSDYCAVRHKSALFLHGCSLPSALFDNKFALFFDFLAPSTRYLRRTATNIHLELPESTCIRFSQSHQFLTHQKIFASLDSNHRTQDAWQLRSDLSSLLVPRNRKT